MEFPTSIHSPKLVGSAGLIARYEARTVTDQPAIVLVAPPAHYGAVSLEAAHKALLVLRQDGRTAFPGCPSLIEPQEMTDEACMLVLGVRGVPLLALAWPDEAVETDVLEVASQHAKLLAALHQAGFSGLQPGFEDLRWDAAHKSLMVLGWEWVRENEESRHEDLQAAAALWVELLTGAAPPVFPPLTPESKGPAWQRVSLGTRALLSSILLDTQATATAEYVHTQLEAIHRNWSRPVDELLSEGLDLLASEQFAAAQALLDLAARRSPDSVGSFRLRETEERATKRFVEIISDIRIGSYYSSVNKLQRVQADGAVTAQERLRAWRWWTIADAAWRLEPLDPQESSDDSGRCVQQLIKAALDIDRRQLKTALNHLQQALAASEADQPPAVLSFLEADLRVCLLIEEAPNLKSTDLATATGLFEQAARELQKLPEGYRTALITQAGDPAIGWEQVKQRLSDQEMIRRSTNEARAALKAEDLPLARQKWNDVLRLKVRSDPERVTIHQELHHVELRSQAMAAGVMGNSATMEAVDISTALHALAQLRSAFPRDPWGVAQAKRWQQMLVAWLKKDPTGPAGAWLFEHWAKSRDVRRSLEQAAPLALASWNARFADVIRDQELPKTPQRVGDWLHRLGSLLAGLDRSRSWIESTSHQEALHTLADSTLDNQIQIRRFAAAQTRLRSQLTAAIETGAFPFNTLAEAEHLGLELFDDADRSVSSLRASLTQRNADQFLPIWQVVLAYAHGAWQSGNREIAGRYYESILANSETPEYVRTFCQVALDQLVRGDGPPMMSADWDASGRYSTKLSGEVDPDIRVGSATNAVNPGAEVSQLADNHLFEQLLQIMDTIANQLSLLHPDENDILAELEGARVLASVDVRNVCSKIPKRIQDNEFRPAYAALHSLLSKKPSELDKRCIEKHMKYFESMRQERIEGILSLVENTLHRLERGEQLPKAEDDRVSSEVKVYTQITDDSELPELWNNRPGTRGRVLRSR